MPRALRRPRSRASAAIGAAVSLSLVLPLAACTVEDVPGERGLHLEFPESVDTSDEAALRAAMQQVADFNRSQTGPVLATWHERLATWVEGAWIASGGNQVELDEESSMSGIVCPADDGAFHIEYVAFSKDEEGIEDTAVTASQTAIGLTIRGTLGEDALPAHLEISYTATTMVRLDGVVVGIDTEGILPTWLDSTEVQALDKAKQVGVHGTPTAEIVKSLTSAAAARVKSLSKQIMKALKAMWTNGYCVGMVAPMETSVDPDSRQEVEVKLLPKSPAEWEQGNEPASGTEIVGRITVELSGSKSVEPKQFESTGSFTYVGPPDLGDRAQLSITGTSRRGGDVKWYNIEVGGGAWLATGSTDGYRITAADRAYLCNPSAEAWAFFHPAHRSATDLVNWTFQASGEMVFLVVQGTSYLRGREGKWMLEEDENGNPSAIIIMFGEGYEIFNPTTNPTEKALNGGSAVFELTRANRPRECDAAPGVGAVVLGPR